MRRSRGLWILLAGLLCIPWLPRLTPGWADPAPRPSASPSASFLQGTLPGIDSVRIETDLMRLRGLKFKQAVPMEVKAKSDFQDDLEQASMQHSDSESATQFTLRGFGLVPPDFSAKAELDYYAGVYLGYYDPKAKKFFMIPENEKPLHGAALMLFDQLGYNPESMTVMHEMDHALQDQYFDLQGVEKKMKEADDSDHALAIKALIEGDAKWVEYAGLFDRMGLAPTAMPSLKRMQDNDANNRSLYQSHVPLILKRVTSFPYVEGSSFVHELRRLGLGWDYVNKAWQDFPDSTQQILHPFLYVGDRRFPTQIRWSSLPKEFGGWKMVDEDSWGEFVISVLFDTLEGEAGAHRALAAGWVGDHYRTYAKGDQGAVLWFSTWKDEATAQEVHKLLLAGWNLPAFKDRPLRIERKGADLLAARGFPSEDLAPVWDDMGKVERKVMSHPVQVHLTESEIYTREEQASKVKLDEQKLARYLPNLEPLQADFVEDGSRWHSPSLKLNVEQFTGWAVKAPDKHETALLTGLYSGTRTRMIMTLQGSSVGDATTMANTAILYSQGLAKVFDQFRVEANDAIQINGATVQRLRATGVERSQSTRLGIAIYVIRPHGRTLIVSFLSAAAASSEMGPEADKFMAGIRSAP